MSIRFTRVPAAAVLAFSLAVGAYAQTTTTQAYNLAEGTRLTFKTSANVNVTGPQKTHKQVQIQTTYTVVSATPQARTIFAEVDLQNEKDPSKWEPGARFSFELMPDGTSGESTAGFAQPPIDGWSHMLDFPLIPAPDAKKQAVPFPLNGQPIQANVSITPADQGSSISLIWDNEQASDESPVRMDKYRAGYIYVPAENAVKSSHLQLNASAKGDESAVTFEARFSSDRTGISKLNPQELASFQKAVASGISLADNVRMLASADEGGTSEALTLLRKYVADYPTSPMNAVFNRMLNAYGTMAALTENAQKIKDGQPAPPFEAKAIDGSTVKLADYKGKVLLIDFWATWCGPCIMELPNVMKLYDANKAKGFDIIGFSADRELQTLQNFVKEQKIGWKQVFEPEPEKGTVMYQYGVLKYPTTVLVDKEGVVRGVDLPSDKLAEAVDKLLTAK